MRLLKRETTIPLPEVLDSSTPQNPIHCPYILMAFTSGKPLYEIWFGHHLEKATTREMTHKRRVRALEGIAAAMTKLDEFTSSTADTLQYGTLSGPIRRIDLRATFNRYFHDNDASDDPIYVQCPPSADILDYYTFILDRHPANHDFARGEAALHRQLVSWIPEPKGVDPFVLAHPDFDVQNLIVDDDETLLAVIDWDGASAKLRSSGNRRYPGWLTRD
ncbi:hypothetical protein BDV19DRAFT_364819 [Aspergillus venezuelensis]